MNTPRMCYDRPLEAYSRRNGRKSFLEWYIRTYNCGPQPQNKYYHPAPTTVAWGLMNTYAPERSKGAKPLAAAGLSSPAPLERPYDPGSVRRRRPAVEPAPLRRSRPP